MATVNELYSSRDGGSEGVLGYENQYVMYQVTLDAITDHPETVVKDLQCPPGTPFPYDEVPCFAGQYTRFRTSAPLIWNVLVQFFPPAIVLTTDKWRVELDAGIDSYHTFEDRNGVPIGPRKYAPVPAQNPGENIADYTARLDAEKRRLDARGYDTLSADTLLYEAYTTDGTRQFWVAKDRYMGRNAVGADRFRPVGGVVAGKVFLQLTDSQVGNVIGKLTAVNSVPYFGAPKGSLMLRAVRTSPNDSVFVGNQPGIDLYLSWSWDSQGHERHVQLIDVIDDGVNQSFVYSATWQGAREIQAAVDGTSQASTFQIFRKAGTTGKFVIVTGFPLYERVNFQSLLAGYLGSAPQGING